MISAGALVGGLADRGVTLVAGVPCSYLTPVINRAISDPAVRYVPATQEGEAVGLAAGAWLGGGLGLVIAQNSGLGNMVNPITSLLHTSRIPAALLVTWRGRPGEADEPQHELMGRITTDLLDLMDVAWATVDADPGALDATLDTARASWSRRDLPAALVLPDGTVDPEPLAEPVHASSRPEIVRTPGGGPPPTRTEVLEALLGALPPDAAIVATTGKTSRELAALDDAERNFYLVGAMGSASAVGAGLAAHTPRPVVVLDGDGAALMRLGTMATVGAHGGENLVHVVLDNGTHDSTGGQRTASTATDLAGVAVACGYRQVHDCADAGTAALAVGAAVLRPGPALVRIGMRPGSPRDLGRPTVRPPEVARRFRDFVTRPPTAGPAAAAPLSHAGGAR